MSLKEKWAQRRLLSLSQLYHFILFWTPALERTDPAHWTNPLKSAENTVSRRQNIFGSEFKQEKVYKSVLQISVTELKAESDFKQKLNSLFLHGFRTVLVPIPMLFNHIQRDVYFIVSFSVANLFYTYSPKE